MLQLNLAAALELEVTARGREAKGVPEAHGRLHPGLILEGAQRRVRVQSPISPCRPCEAILEEHADDGHHGQAAIGQLRGKFLLPRIRVVDGGRRETEDKVVPDAEEAVALVVARGASRVLPPEEALVVPKEEGNLQESLDGDLGKRPEAAGDIRKLQAQGGADVAWKLGVLRHNVADACQHADAAVLEFHSAAALEGVNVAVRGQAERVPEADRCLDAKLSLESAREPHLRPGGANEAVLPNHACDSDHGQTPIVDLRIQGAPVLDRVGDAAREGHAKLAAEGGVSRGPVWLLPKREQLQEGDEDPDLRPTICRHFGQSGDAVREVSELNIRRGR
mmetsp:Transcript_109188/g.223060  ORF Transcript_109188/g.223060 Transcript_109188/m.223060 type:complete len:336 (+) Transcript_109188:373-1380(+)